MNDELGGTWKAEVVTWTEENHEILVGVVVVPAQISNPSSRKYAGSIVAWSSFRYIIVKYNGT
jgi:hypothetical protein